MDMVVSLGATAEKECGASANLLQRAGRETSGEVQRRQQQRDQQLARENSKHHLKQRRRLSHDETSPCSRLLQRWRLVNMPFRTLLRRTAPSAPIAALRVCLGQHRLHRHAHLVSARVGGQRATGSRAAELDARRRAGPCGSDLMTAGNDIGNLRPLCRPEIRGREIIVGRRH